MIIYLLKMVLENDEQTILGAVVIAEDETQARELVAQYACYDDWKDAEIELLGISDPDLLIPEVVMLDEPLAIVQCTVRGSPVHWLGR